MQSTLAAGQPAFVDFTASWCLSCQVNERVALDQPEVMQAFGARNVALFKADWTRQDPAITQALAALGRSGVPVYALYTPGAEQPAAFAAGAHAGHRDGRAQQAAPGSAATQAAFRIRPSKSEREICSHPIQFVARLNSPSEVDSHEIFPSLAAVAALRLRAARLIAAQAVVGSPAPAVHRDRLARPNPTLSESAANIVVLEWHNHDCPYTRKHYDCGNMEALQKEWTAKGVSLVHRDFLCTGPARIHHGR